MPLAIKTMAITEAQAATEVHAEVEAMRAVSGLKHFGQLVACCVSDDKCTAHLITRWAPAVDMTAHALYAALTSLCMSCSLSSVYACVGPNSGGGNPSPPGGAHALPLVFLHIAHQV